MKHRDGIFASLALAASVAVMAGLVASDEYAHATRAEAAGYEALLHELAGPPQIMPLQVGTTGVALLVTGEAWQ